MQVTDGKHRLTQHCFRDRPQKIALVLVFVHTHIQLPVLCLRVVAGRDLGCTARLREFKELAEFYLAVAQGVGVGRPAAGELGDREREHFLLILF